MGAYLVKRLLMLPPVLLGVTVIVFLVMALIPGDPALAILGTYATPANLAQVRVELGLNHALPIRYLFWLSALLHGNLGWSYILHKPVLDEVMSRLGPTMLLAGASLVLCAIIGIPLGIIAAVRQNAWEDKLITVTVLVGVSTPSFWLGMLLILWFAVRLQWLPDGGMYDLFGDGGVMDVLTHLALPAITLAAVPAAVLVRLTRTAMLEVMRQDYVRTARAKGVKESRVILRHVFGNALVGVIPILGIEAGYVLGGAVYVETVFQWPGIGQMLVNAISTRDILLVQGGVLVVATAYIVINLLTDIAQAMLDRRIQTS
ncbi:ABC transporter permease [Acidisoma sp.]|uniref:ABC transporter permease n=1 Tax=Acidisoma sp. TaxID=1872115 RepID=UPI003AFF801F